MRNGQTSHSSQHNNNHNKRMRGRNNNRKGQSPLTRLFESNGPDVKIRGTAAHIADKYVQLARDAQSSGDPVAAEAYYQHAEHYFRLIAAAQEQFRQSPQPFFRDSNDAREAQYEDGEDDGDGDAPYAPREPHAQPQPQAPFAGGRDVGGREAPHYQHREGRQPRAEAQPYAPRPQQPAPPPIQADGGDIERLPAFVTGGSSGAPSFGANGQGGGTSQAAGDGGAAGSGDYEAASERFPAHRRRRRRHGPRPEGAQGGPAEADAGSESSASSAEPFSPQGE